MSAGQFSAAVRDLFELLTFRLSADRAEKFDRRHFYLGLVGTWLAGVGRYWDHPSPQLAQRWGLGSLGYVVVMAALLWAVFRPVAGAKARYWNLLTFVALTSFPAWLYAIPVERFMSMEGAISANVWFLAVVALWRVILLFRHARGVLGLSGLSVAICCLLPLTGIIVLLAWLNLENAVFEIMGGLRQPTSNDGAYLVILVLSWFSVILAPILLLAWGWLIFARRRRSTEPGARSRF